MLDEIVLTSLRKVTAYAREHTDGFYKIAMENGELEAKKLFKETESLRNEYGLRINQLDNAISMLYMDRVTGRITPERYDILAADYEKEQSDLKSKLAELASRIDDMNLREKCVSDFIKKAKQYIDMPKLTPELLRAFISRIEVYEKPEKYSRTCGNHIIIYFTFQPDKAIRIDGAMTELDTTAFA